MASPALPIAEISTDALDDAQERPRSGVHRIALPCPSPANESYEPNDSAQLDAAQADDWRRLVELWESRGHGDAPPKCMAEYAAALIEALA